MLIEGIIESNLAWSINVFLSTTFLSLEGFFDIMKHFLCVKFSTISEDTLIGVKLFTSLIES